MWQLKNQTPFSAERCFVRDKNGAEVWIVAVKATFNIDPNGSTHLAEEQMPVCMAAEYRGEPGQSSLLYDSDLVHTKLGTDIILNAHAYAPPDQQVTQITVGFQVGMLSKYLLVFGDRYWKAALFGPKMTATEPFTTMPIVYERAFGGIDTTTPERPLMSPHNPVGSGFSVNSEGILNQRLANIECPDPLIRSWKHRPLPAGFGAIAGDWLPRRTFAGTYDEQWEKTRQPLLPKDFNELFYHCAPQDQQVTGYLTGGEPVILYNLSPSGEMRFQLPVVSLGFKTFFGTQAEAHHALLHTVIIEPDIPRVMLVWHTHLPCHNREHKLDHTAISLKK